MMSNPNSDSTTNKEILTSDVRLSESDTDASAVELNTLITQVEQVLSEQTEFELSLDSESFLAESLTEQELKAAIDDTAEPQKAESARLPSVLVDEELLSELARIPDRFGFKIGDVADLLGIKQYVLRYWEEEFEILKPKKASNNQRLYTKKDVENAFLIRKLLYRDKFSIEGARQALRDVKFAVKKEKDLTSVIQRIDFVQTQIKSFVDEIKKTKKMFN
jgi:DNA-binding transcriptional MerR regulator